MFGEVNRPISNMWADNNREKSILSQLELKLGGQTRFGDLCRYTRFRFGFRVEWMLIGAVQEGFDR